MTSFVFPSYFRKRNPNLQVTLSVGGQAQGSEYFSVMVRTEECRSKFVESALEFMEKHNFDGIDINWHYPGEKDDLDKEQAAC